MARIQRDLGRDLMRSSSRNLSRGINLPQRNPRQQADPEVQMYVNELVEQKEEEESRVKPLQWVFDRLSTGQYLTANIANRIIDSIQGDDDYTEGTLLDDVTGAIAPGRAENFRDMDKRGDFTDVIINVAGGQEKHEQRGKGLKFATNIGGFLLNVLLDPLTYVSLGSTAAAKSAATRYADDMRRLFFKNTDAATRALAQFVPNQKLVGQITDLAKTDPQKAVQLFLQNGSRDARMYMDNMVRNLRREGMQLTEEAARKNVIGRITALLPENTSQRALDVYTTELSRIDDLIKNTLDRGQRDKLITNLDAMRKNEPEIKQALLRYFKEPTQENLQKIGVKNVAKKAKAVYGKMKKQFGDDFRQISDLIDETGAPFMKDGGFDPATYHGSDGHLMRMMAEVSEGTRYQGMGGVGFNTIFGNSLKEAGGIMKRGFNLTRDGFRAIGDVIGKLPAGRGKTFAEAWWNVQNTGAIGAIRKALGIRGPYEQMLNVARMDVLNKADALADDWRHTAKQAFDEASDEVKEGWSIVRGRAAKLEKEALERMELEFAPALKILRVKKLLPPRGSFDSLRNMTLVEGAPQDAQEAMREILDFAYNHAYGRSFDEIFDLVSNEGFDVVEIGMRHALNTLVSVKGATNTGKAFSILRPWYESLDDAAKKATNAAGESIGSMMSSVSKTLRGAGNANEKIAGAVSMIDDFISRNGDQYGLRPIRDQLERMSLSGAPGEVAEAAGQIGAREAARESSQRVGQYTPESLMGESRKAMATLEGYMGEFEKVALGDIRASRPYRQLINMLYQPMSNGKKYIDPERMAAGINDFLSNVDDFAVGRMVGVTDDEVKMVRNIADMLLNDAPKGAAPVAQAAATTVATKAADEVVDKGAQELIDMSDDIVKLNDQLQPIFDDMNKYAQQANADGIVAAYSPYEIYMPVIFDSNMSTMRNKLAERGVFRTSFMKNQTQGFENVKEGLASVYRDIWGMDDKVIKAMMDKGGGVGIIASPEKMMMRRIASEVAMLKRVDIIRQFRQFGIKLDELNDILPSGTALQQAAKKAFGDLDMAQMGLKKIDDKALEGYFFDDQVAQVLQRAVTLNDIDPNTVTKKILDQYTSWFKSVATTSPGFHIRNKISGDFTGYMKHGVRWFRPKEGYNSAVAATVALYGEETAGKWFGGVERVRDILQQQYGGFSLEKWMRYAKNNNLLSRSSMVASRGELERIAAQTGRKIARANPLSSKFVAYDASRQIGSVIESSQRFKSFLLDLDMLAKGNDAQATSAMAEYAKLEAKKWFLDYDDLSPTEQKVLKRVIPFYTWIRKNLSNQFSALASPEYWGRLAAAPKIANFRWFGDEDSLDLQDAPNYVEEGGFSRTGLTSDDLANILPNLFDPNGKDILFRLQLPINDINILPIAFDRNGLPTTVVGESLMNNMVVEAAHPFIKAFLAKVTNYDTFTGREIDTQVKAPRTMQLFAQNPRFMAVIDGMLRLANFENGLLASRDMESDSLKLNGQVVKVLEALNPLSRTIAMGLDTTEVLSRISGQDLEAIIDHVAGYSDPYDKTTELLRSLSWAMGVGITSYDPDEQRFYRGMDIYDDALEKRRIARSETPESNIRRLRWREQNETILRRLGLY
jgi:hypothetical protein